jgi:hypothetical protein
MPVPTEQPDRFSKVLMIFGGFFVLLIGFVVWQPKATILIAEAVEAEHAAQIQDQAPPVRLAAEPNRKPIGPGEWAHVFKREDVVQNSSR